MILATDLDGIWPMTDQRHLARETWGIVSPGAAQARLPADRNPVPVYLARLAPGSRETMSGALKIMSGILTSGEGGDPSAIPWHRMRYQHAQALREQIAERYAPATANKMLSALRGVLKEAWRLELMSAEDYHRAIDLAPVRGKTLPAGRSLKQAEIMALFDVCATEQSPAGVRDATLLALGYGAGLRVSELVGLDLQDYAPEDRALLIRGKGHKERVAYLTDGSRDALEAWLTIRGALPGPIFWPVNKGGRLVEGQRITRSAVNRMLIRRARSAGVSRFSPHDLRRTFVGDLLDRGADLASVQQLTGHANPQTTARYDRRGERAKRKTAELLVVPFRRPAPSEGSVNPERRKEVSP